jgi:hypothetical protein
MADSPKSAGEIGRGADSDFVLDEADAEAERFFAQGEQHAEADTLAPTELAGHEDDAVPRAPPISPELLVRRARLRRIVAVGLGGAVTLMGLQIGATRLSRSLARRSAAPEHTAAALAPSASGAGHRVPAPKAPLRQSLPEVSEPPLPDPSATESPAPEPSASAPAASSSSLAPGADTADATRAARLIAEARALLRVGRARDGVAAARSAVEAQPTLGEPYVLLAAGLEDLGRWGEARRTFATCAERTHDAQCSYFAKGIR